MRSPKSRKVLSLSAVLCCLLLPTAAGEAQVWLNITQPSVSAASTTASWTFRTAITMASWDRAPAALHLTVRYDPGIIRPVSFACPGDSPFFPNCDANWGDGSAGEVQIAAFQTTNSEPLTTATVFAWLTWEFVGTSGSGVALQLDVHDLVDMRWRPSEVMVYGEHSVWDADADGMSDVWEREHGFDPTDAGDAGEDPDNDGLVNLQEFSVGADPRNRDTDGDLFGDGEEASLGTDLSDPSSKPATGHFSDVPAQPYNEDGDAAHWAFHEIEAAFRAGIVAGYLDGTYAPVSPVNRDAMAVYIARSLCGGDEAVPEGPAEATFADVAASHWAYKYVEYCYAEQVVKGYARDSYAPSVEVDRGQMATFLARANGWIGIDDDMATAPEIFPDVPAGYWAGTAIQACVDNGVVRGYDDGYYHPEVTVARDQMAVYVQRAFDLPM